jgi:hypothetical protein
VTILGISCRAESAFRCQQMYSHESMPLFLKVPEGKFPSQARRPFPLDQPPFKLHIVNLSYSATMIYPRIEEVILKPSFWTLNCFSKTAKLYPR